MGLTKNTAPVMSAKARIIAGIYGVVLFILTVRLFIIPDLINRHVMNVTKRLHNIIVAIIPPKGVLKNRRCNS